MERRKMSSEHTNHVEERMWGVLRPFFSKKGEAAAARRLNHGLWKAPHVSQICHWDCGVSCAQMVLRGLGREAERSSLLASLGTRSVWTIDLAMLLHRQGDPLFMYGTRTVGVTEAYSTIDFYRANFDHDAPRVQSLFKAAEEANVGAVQKTFSWQELAVLVSSYNYAAIVLVDSRYLHATSYRGSTAAAAAPALAPSAPVLGPPSPYLAPPSPAAVDAVESTPPQQSWSTPKRHREEAEEEAGARGWGGSGEFAAGAGDAVRRRRKRPAPAGATPIERSLGGPREALGAASGASAALASPLSARDANTGHLRLSPAVGDDGGDMAVFVTPPAPKSGRKYLAGDLGASSRAGGTAGVISQQGGENGRRDDQMSAEPPVQSAMPSATGPVSPPVSAQAPSPAGSPRGSPPPILVGSPPPLKAAGLVSPPASGGDRAASSPKDSSYCGHYILLVGWSEADRVFIARDPALTSSTPSMATAPGGAGGGDPNAHACIALTPEALDRARRSYGTDEDVLVIDLARSRKGGVPTAPLAAAAAATALAASAASSAAAASAMVGILAMAAAAAAAGAEASGFKEWAWPDRAAWFSGHHAAIVDSAADVDGTGGAGASGGDKVVGRRGMPLSGAESAARRLASLLSLAASGLRFPTVGDAYRGPGILWGSGATGGGGDGGGGGSGSGSGSGSGADVEEKEEQERWAVRTASAMLLEGGRRAVYTMEGLLQGGRRAAYTMEGFLQGGANTMEGLLQGGRRAAYTMEGLLEGGRRAAYNLRDQLADVADAPGGAGAECCSIAVLTAPGSPVSPARMPVVSPA
ncbi:unnamed protein product [Ectocarpus sp. CCAP 1310/34]|nr:unnamed protein product [Ectocarpus sp. CCAP 1310/34]